MLLRPDLSIGKQNDPLCVNLLLNKHSSKKGTKSLLAKFRINNMFAERSGLTGYFYSA